MYSAMSSRLHISAVVFCVFGTLVLPTYLNGQTLACPVRSGSDSDQNLKITIADVEFPGANPLPQDVRGQLVERVKKLELHQPMGGDDADWLAQVEDEIRDGVQKYGYFRALLTSMTYLIQSEAHERRYIVRVEIDSGPQYHLNQITFSGATVFQAQDLRKEFSQHQGDLFDVSKLRIGMNSVTRLNQRLGFINMTAEPQFRIDDKNQLISVAVKIDEDTQYHVRNVEIRGLGKAEEQAVKSQFGFGQIFSPQLLESLVERYN